MSSLKLILCTILALIGCACVNGFQQANLHAASRGSTTKLSFFGNKKEKEKVTEMQVPEEKKKVGFFGDLKGMMENFDAVVDDFVYKRMGAGEQWYGKRKYNPSGNVDGDYNGMGQSDLIRIEVARVRREEMELRRQRRLEAEEEAKSRGKN